MAERKTIQLPLGGMYASGDPAMIPDGTTRLMENMVHRPGRWEKRAPYRYDGLSDTIGFANWSDETNNLQRVVAVVYDGLGNHEIRLKATAAETYTSITGTSGAGYVPSFANYRGVLYYTIGAASASNQTPTGLHSFDGTTVKQYPLGGETIYGLCVASFLDRIIIANGKSSVVNQLGTTVAYDPTSWSTVTTTTTNITNGSSVTGRITPTATTLSQIFKNGVYTVAASTTDTALIFRSDLRNTSPTYEMPMTSEIYYSQAWVADTAMTVGAIRVPATVGAGLGTGNGYRYRVTAVAGDTKTHAVTEPTWPTTIGTTVVDDQVTWICDGPDAIASMPVTLPTLTAGTEFYQVWTRATVPPMPASAGVGVRLKFGNAATGTITTVPVDISFKDGLTDGNARKTNRGQQLTIGKFAYPFFNQESSGTATVVLENDIYWTETSDPNSIYGDNYYRLRDRAGRVTAMTTMGGRLIVFKRRGMWVFRGTDDPENPLLLETFLGDVGCVGSRALTVFEDTLYFVGEEEVYSYRVGGEPKPLCGDGMRETVMSRTAWRESFGVSDGLGSLAVGIITAEVDAANRDLHVGTQTTSVFVCDIDNGEWSTLTPASGNAPGLLLWNNSKRRMYCVGGDTNRFSLRIDESVAPAYDIFDNVATNSTVTAAITLRPLEALFPRKEFALDIVGVHHMSTGTQTNSTFTVAASLNGGHTFTKTNAPVLTLASSATTKVRVPVPMRQGGQNMVVKITHAGEAGGTMFKLTAVDADVRILRETERIISIPTQGSASL